MKKLISIILIVCFLLPYQPVFASDYILAPQDQLEIRIIGQKDLDTKQTITPDGTISLPLLNRVTAQGQTLAAFNKYLSAEFAKYIKNPQVVVYLTPRPIYVIQRDVKRNIWDVKEAKSIDEAKAYMGPAYSDSPLSRGDVLSDTERAKRVEVESKDRGVKYGNVYTVTIGKQSDFWEDNWYKVLTATAVAVGIYATLHR